MLDDDYWPSSSNSTMASSIVSRRGFQPSDRHDPHKRELLTTLTARLWHLSLVLDKKNYRRECVFLGFFLIAMPFAF